MIVGKDKKAELCCAQSLHLRNFTKNLCLGVVIIMNLLSITSLLQPGGGKVAAATSSASASTFEICYFFFANIDDFGWTFSHNNGRMATHLALQEKYPTLSIRSRYEQSVAFRTVEEKRLLFFESIQQRNCSIIVTASAGILGVDEAWAARTYPNVSFLLLDDTVVARGPSQNWTEYPNRAYYSALFDTPYFFAGVAAALVTKTNRLGFVSAWPNEPNPVDAANGFLRGVRHINPTLSVHLVTMNSWYNPGAERDAAEVLVDLLGCDIIARYTDSSAVDDFIAERSSSTSGETQSQQQQTQLYSIGPHTRLQEYIGDSVLISIFEQWETFLVPMLSTAIESSGALNSNSSSGSGSNESPRPFLDHSHLPVTTGWDNASLKVSALSTLAQDEGHQQKLKDLINSGNFSDSKIFCDSNLRTLYSQKEVIPAELRNPETGCRQAGFSLLEYIDFSQIDHGKFSGSATCPAGHQYNYDLHLQSSSSGGTSSSSSSPLIRLVCTPCPVNFYSESQGSATCTPCPEGTDTQGLVGALSCVVIPTDYTLIIILALVAGVFLILALVLGLRLVSSSRRNRFAVTKPPLCIIFTDVESSTKLWADHPKAMSKAIRLHHRIVRSIINSHKVYEVKVLGDAFMIAAESVLEATQVAVDIQTALVNCQTWPEEFTSLREAGEEACWNGLLVRMGLHYCSNEGGGGCSVEWDRLHQYYDYYGNDVNACSRISSLARGGEILMSGGTLSKLLEDPMYSVVMQSDVQIQLQGRSVMLRGIQDEYFNIFSVTPTTLLGREHPMESLSFNGGASVTCDLSKKSTEKYESQSLVGIYLNGDGGPLSGLGRLVNGGGNIDGKQQQQQKSNNHNPESTNQLGGGGAGGAHLMIDIPSTTSGSSSSPPHSHINSNSHDLTHSSSTNNKVNSNITTTTNIVVGSSSSSSSLAPVPKAISTTNPLELSQNQQQQQTHLMVVDDLESHHSSDVASTISSIFEPDVVLVRQCIKGLLNPQSFARPPPIQADSRDTSVQQHDSGDESFVGRDHGNSSAIESWKRTKPHENGGGSPPKVSTTSILAAQEKALAAVFKLHNINSSQGYARSIGELSLKVYKKMKFQLPGGVGGATVVAAPHPHHLAGANVGSGGGAVGIGETPDLLHTPISTLTGGTTMLVGGGLHSSSSSATAANHSQAATTILSGGIGQAWGGGGASVTGSNATPTNSSSSISRHYPAPIPVLRQEARVHMRLNTPGIGGGRGERSTVVAGSSRGDHTFISSSNSSSVNNTGGSSGILGHNSNNNKTTRVLGTMSANNKSSNVESGTEGADATTVKF